MSYADVTDPADAEKLAARIMLARERPLVVVSSTPDGGFLFDVELLRHELDGIADVTTLKTGPASKRLEPLLPYKAHVFNGAARSYPPDFVDDPDWTRSVLRFPEHADTSDLINDAMTQTGLRRVSSAPAPASRRATGTVQGFLSDDAHALVRLDDGSTVTATGALLPPDIPLSAALVIGEPVRGVLVGTELHPEPLEPATDAFADGDQTLALVVKVTELRATVQLHPQATAVLRRRDVSTEELPVNELLSVGDVIRVRVRRSASGELSLSHSDADPAAPLTPALALVVGGAPWLSEDRPVRSSASAPGVPTHQPSAHGTSASGASERTSSPGSPATAPQTGPAHADHATRADVSAMAREIAALRGDILALTNLVGRANAGPGTHGAQDSELTRLRTENDQLRAKLAAERADRASAESRLGEAVQDRRDAGRALRDARRAAERSHVDATDDGIRFEIERTWANRTAAGERERWPLREYALGADFISSLAALDEGQLSKAIRTCVDAVTGRDREIPARELHRLRTGEGGDDPYVVRADGARCWRSSIEQNAPGARRLHYWELPGGVIELSRVVHHDDTRP